MMKKGISLIVLVITIIVMIILAASVVITLSNTGIINRASEAVDATNEAQVQDMAALIWADAYMDDKRGPDLVNEVTTKLGEQGVTSDKWNITVTDTGVTVTNKNSSSGTGLGSLITAANYGDKVDYSVTVNGITYDDWQIYYHNSDYVYLITENSITNVTFDNIDTVASLTSEELALYEKFRVGDFEKYALVDVVNGTSTNNSRVAVELIKDYSAFSNITEYGTYVVGALGGPTMELFVSAWNSKGYTPKMELTKGEYGYKINGSVFIMNLTNDDVYVKSDASYVFASPADYNGYCMFVTSNMIFYQFPNNARSVRPVVCLKASIPATVGTGDYDFSLTK